MYPHERSLVQRYKPEQFTILGIDSDPKPVLEKVIKAGTIIWPCIADGRGGPIAEQWGIRQYPTLFLLDHKGVIRYHDEIRDDVVMKQALQTLMAEWKAAHK